MAPETEPVRIVIEIIDNFSDELQELRQELNQIDAKNLDIDLHIEDNGDVESVRAQLEALQERLESTLDIDTTGFESAMAQKQALRGDIRSNVIFDADEREGLQDILDTSLNRAVSDVDMRWQDTDDRLLGGLVDSDLAEQNRRVRRTMGNLGEHRNMLGGSRPQFTPDMQFPRRDFGDFRMGRGGIVPDDLFEGLGGFARGSGGMVDIDLEEWAEGSQRSMAKLGRTLLEYRPSIMDWWNVLALLIPIMITLVGAALGLAAALVAVGTAGAAIVGAGLLGWGDDTQSMMRNLQREANQLKEALFGAVQPLAQQAQPIVDDWLDGAPRHAQRLATAMEPLLSFEDEIAAMGAGFINFLVEAFAQMASVEEEVTQVTMRMGSALGGFLNDAMRSLVLEVYKNQEALIDIAQLFLSAIVTIYNLAKAVTFVVAQFGFLLRAFEIVTGFLSNKWVVAFLTAVTTALLLNAAISSLITGYYALQAGIVATAISTVSKYIPSVVTAISATWGWVTAVNGLNAALRGLLVLTGALGAAWAIGTMATGAMESMSGPQPGAAGTGVSSTGRGGTTINIQGDVRKKEMNRILDEVPSETRTEMNTANSMEGQ